MSTTMSFDNTYCLDQLKNGSSPEMNVDGTTPVTFKHAISAGEVWLLERITFFILDPGTMSQNHFGSLGTALTNGLKVVLKKKGTEFKIKDIKDNVDLYMSFPFDSKTGSTSTGFLNEEDHFSGSLIFKQPIRLVGNREDLVKIVVQDDCTGVQRMRASALLWRPI